MRNRLILAAALAVGLSSLVPAQAQVAQVIATCGTANLPLGPGARLYMDSTGTLCTVAGAGGGGGGATGSVTAPGTSGSSAQAVQGITGGVPVGVSGTVAATQSGSWSVGLTGTLPAFASTPTFNIGTTNGLALDATIIARLGTLGQKASTGSTPVVIASDQSSIPVTASGTVTANLGTLNGAATAANQNSTAAGTSATNAQAVQGVTGGVPQNVANGGTFAVQNTAAVVGGNATAVKTDGSATTQPVSATALPLPSGASTSANQSTEITALQLANQRNAPVLDTSAAIAASATFTSAVRDSAASGSNPFTRWVGLFNPTQAGTGILQLSPDNANWFSVSQQAVAAGATVTLSVPLVMRYARLVFVNGSTAGTLVAASALQAN